MDNLSTVKERLIQFIKHLGIGQGRFERNCGLSNGYVNNIRKSVTPEKLLQIADEYPELNTGWLMTGEGEMLRTEQNTTPLENAAVNKIYSENERLNNRVDELLAQNRILIETLHSQMEIIKKTTAQLDEDAGCAAVS